MLLRRLLDTLWLIAFWSAGLLLLLVLVSILGYLAYRGHSVITLEFLLASPKGLPLGAEGGILPAIKGTLCLVLLAVATAILPALATAVYLAEYARHEGMRQVINTTVQCMAGLPSIVTGLFCYALFVVRLGFGISLLAGGVALGMMVFPVIVVTARDALLAVNNHYRMVGLSLGVSRWYLLIRILLPQAAAGILGGILLAMGYAAGATAPIMVTAAAIATPSAGNLWEPVMALPYHLYILFSQQVSLDKAYGTALVLVSLLLILNIIAMWLRHRNGR